MHRIDNPSAASSVPAPEQAGIPGYFTEGNPTSGLEATIVSADWANALQEEVSYVIEQAGLVLSKTDRTQLAQALAILTRRRLTAPLTLYVSPTGNDNSDGLTPGSALRTITHAWNFFRDRIDCNGYLPTIQLMDGTHAAGSLAGLINPAPLIVGNVTSPQNVIVNGATGPAIAAQAGAVVGVRSFTVTATGPAGDYGGVGSGLLAASSAYISMSKINFGACSLAHIQGYAGGSIACSQINDTYQISGAAMYHLYANGGYTITPDAHVTLNGVYPFTQFAHAQNGIVSAWNMIFTGTATGSRYYSHMNGLINTANGGANYFPGSTVGTVDTGGLYL